METHSQPSYKLTSYPIGSIAELWTISWPLMIGLLSSSIMMFVDRLILARYSALALNAAATAGMAFWAFAIVPLVCAGISEVFVGRNHGAGRMQEVGRPVWQMVWMSCGTLPLFLLCGWLAPQFIFSGTGNEILETAYFRSFMLFGPFFCSTVALIGFFVGIGQVRIVTASAIVGNIVNIGLDLLLVFGYGSIPALGAHGAAVATGLSQIVQTVFLLMFFLRKKYRLDYRTADYSFRWGYFKESLVMGGPVGIGKFLEMLAHFVFFRIAAQSGPENLTIITVAQSFYLLLCFVIEGLSKGVSSLVANLLGGKQFDALYKVLRAGMILQTIFFIILAMLMILFSSPILLLFFSGAGAQFLTDPTFVATALSSLHWMCLFFLLDGFGWVYMGFLTAAGDTKFILYAGIVLNLFGYIVPTYFVLGVARALADKGWMLITVYAFVTFLTYAWRYRSKRWLKVFRETTAAAQ